MQDNTTNHINPYWGILPIITVIWHGIYTVQFWDAQHLLFVCYSANLLVGIGVIFKNKLMTGLGLCWVIVGLPLWLVYAVAQNDWVLSGIAFHFCGVIVGIMAVRNYKLPNYLGVLSVLFGVFFFALSRLFTNPANNINGSFKMYYQGLAGYIPEGMYFFIYFCGVSAFCLVLPYAINKLLMGKN